MIIQAGTGVKRLRHNLFYFFPLSAILRRQKGILLADIAKSEDY
jgi:hypothetical protein